MAAKQAAADAAAASNTTADGRSIHLVSSAEILKQAEFLSRRTETIVMPRPVWQSYKRALAGQKQYAARYAEEALVENAEVDGHVAFIEVLEKSAEYIQDIATVQRIASATAPKSESTEVKLSNLLRSLELSETMMMMTKH
jgi:hypothetical protein